jgi:hypothetical protein
MFTSGLMALPGESASFSASSAGLPAAPPTQPPVESV